VKLNFTVITCNTVKNEAILTKSVKKLKQITETRKFHTVRSHHLRRMVNDQEIDH